MGSVVQSVASPVMKEVGNLYGEISGANAAADAAGAAAAARERAAKQNRELILKEGRAQQESARELAEATPQELLAYEQQLDSSMKQMETRQRMIDAIDPALMEASEQVLALLQGDEAGLTKATQGQRMKQREQLVNQLRSQYGPGAETSSIGRQALDRFDSESNMLTAQTQQGALAQAFGIASSAPGLTDMNSALSALQSSGRNFGALQERMLNTEMQTGSNILSGLSGTAQSMISSAGSQYVAPMMRAQSKQQLFNMGTEAGLAYLTGGASVAAKPQLAAPKLGRSITTSDNGSVGHFGMKA